MAIPQAGAQAPDFDLPTSGGGRLRLSSLQGKRVVLYTYPKDDTPGCTIETRAFTDRLADLEAADAVVVGLNNDDVPTHDAWIAKLGIPFVLVADTEHTALDAYGSYGEQKFGDRTFTGPMRNTFLIGRDGRIEHVWEKVKPEGHVDEVLEALREPEGSRAPA